MQAVRTTRILMPLILAAMVMAPFPATAQDEETPATEDTANEPVVSEEEANALREELEQREAERDQARQQNCEQARAQLAQIADLPPRNVRKTLDDGTVTRMTEEEKEAYMQELRDIEARDCD